VRGQQGNDWVIWKPWASSPVEAGRTRLLVDEGESSSMENRGHAFSSSTFSVDDSRSLLASTRYQVEHLGPRKVWHLLPIVRPLLPPPDFR